MKGKRTAKHQLQRIGDTCDKIFKKLVETENPLFFS